MATGTLPFSPARPARTTDPASSWDAAAEHHSSGRLGRNARVVLEALKHNPNCTAGEIHAIIDHNRDPVLDFVEVVRRLSDLRAAGLACNVPINPDNPNGRKVMRHCPHRNSLCQIWRAT